MMPSLLTSTRRGRLGLALAVLLLAAPVAANADAFDNTWCEVNTGDFRLITDASVAEARAMVRTLQVFRPVASRYLPGTANPEDPPLRVVVFSGRRDFRRAIDGGNVVGYLLPAFSESLMVVGPDPNAFAEHESLLHEYVHYLLRTRHAINLPTWYDEGLAGMLSSARLEDGRLVLGDLPTRRIERGVRQSKLSLADVLDGEDIWDWRPDRVRGFYDLSRLLVHRLALGQLAGRSDWRAGLEAFLAEEHTSLPAALGLSPAAMERRLLRYLDRPASVAHDVRLPADDDLQLRCLDQSETVVQVSQAIVYHHPDYAAQALRRRLEVDPDNADLWRTLSVAEESRGDRDAALAAARRALALAPDDPAAATRVASALAMGCVLGVSPECRARWQEAVPLLRASLRQDPRRQEAIFTLGLAYLYSGRAGDALNYLRIAHRRQPWAPHVNFYLGESYRLIGDSRAEQHLERARRWSPTELWRRLAEAGLEALHGEAS